MFGRVSSVLGAVALGACTEQGPTLNAQAEQMELALVSCKAQLGFDGQLQTDVSFEGGIANARAVPFDQITAMRADQINICAGQSVTLADGMEVVPLPVAQIETRLPAAEPRGAGPCPAGITGMYAGTLYCVAGAL